MIVAGPFSPARPLYPARQISGDHGQFLRGFHEFLVRRYHRDLAINPFRKYFVSDMHGKYPLPEATATTQVPVSGEKGEAKRSP